MSDPIGIFGQPGGELRQISAVDLQSVAAAGLHVAKRYGCMVSIADNPPDFRGSGTLVRVGNTVFVATARHLFKRVVPADRACFWWAQGSRHECVAVEDIRWPEGDVDIAAVRLTQTRKHGLPLDRLELNPTEDGSELWIVSGISQAGVSRDFETKTMRASWWALGLCALPRDRWPNVASAGVAGRDLFAHYSKSYALDANGKAMPAVDPHGLSGGGMWSVRGPRDHIWSPDNAAHLIGIEYATGESTWSWLRGTRIAEWLKVVRDNWPDAATVITSRLET